MKKINWYNVLPFALLKYSIGFQLKEPEHVSNVCYVPLCHTKFATKCLRKFLVWILDFHGLKLNSSVYSHHCCCHLKFSAFSILIAWIKLCNSWGKNVNHMHMETGTSCAALASSSLVNERKILSKMVMCQIESFTVGSNAAWVIGAHCCSAAAVFASQDASRLPHLRCSIICRNVLRGRSPGGRF